MQLNSKDRLRDTIYQIAVHSGKPVKLRAAVGTADNFVSDDDVAEDAKVAYLHTHNTSDVWLQAAALTTSAQILRELVGRDTVNMLKTVLTNPHITADIVCQCAELYVANPRKGFLRELFEAAVRLGVTLDIGLERGEVAADLYDVYDGGPTDKKSRVWRNAVARKDPNVVAYAHGKLALLEQMNPRGMVDMGELLPLVGDTQLRTILDRFDGTQRESSEMHALTEGLRRGLIDEVELVGFARMSLLTTLSASRQDPYVTCNTSDDFIRRAWTNNDPVLGAWAEAARTDTRGRIPNIDGWITLSRNGGGQVWPGLRMIGTMRKLAEGSEVPEDVRERITRVCDRWDVLNGNDAAGISTLVDTAGWGQIVRSPHISTAALVDVTTSPDNAYPPATIALITDTLIQSRGWDTTLLPLCGFASLDRLLRVTPQALVSERVVRLWCAQSSQNRRRVHQGYLKGHLDWAYDHGELHEVVLDMQVSRVFAWIDGRGTGWQHVAEAVGGYMNDDGDAWVDAVNLLNNIEGREDLTLREWLTVASILRT